MTPTSDIPDWLQRDPWFPVIAPIRTSPQERRRGRQFTLDVAGQFRVTKAPRYFRNKGGFTQCNIFTWDFTSAMGCEIPHWVDPATKSKPAPHGQGNAELDGNASCAWLEVHGVQNHGWAFTHSDTEAIKLVEEGKVVVAAWINPGGIGHIAPCVPAFVGPGLNITQAGARNFDNLHIRNGFGDKPYKLFWHE